jgi:hypothetical protein
MDISPSFFVDIREQSPFTIPPSFLDILALSQSYSSSMHPRDIPRPFFLDAPSRCPVVIPIPFILPQYPRDPVHAPFPFIFQHQCSSILSTTPFPFIFQHQCSSILSTAPFPFIFLQRYDNSSIVFIALWMTYIVVECAS